MLSYHCVESTGAEQKQNKYNFSDILAALTFITYIF